MTSVAQVKQVSRPLLERNSDLALVGRLVVLKPIRHLLRGIYIDRGSNPDIFRPTWLVNILFQPGAHASFDWGERLDRRTRGVWDVGDPATPTEMCDVIEQCALPMLRRLHSIDDFVTFTSKERFPWTYLDGSLFSKTIVDVARANFDAAQASCAKVAGRRTPPPPDRLEEFDVLTKLLPPLLACSDRAGLAHLLHGWEADSVKRLKLDEFWEPTPFPIESVR